MKTKAACIICKRRAKAMPLRRKVTKCLKHFYMEFPKNIKHIWEEK